MNRVDRLHAIMVHLQSKKRVTAREIADRFELSLRTVYRDIKALDESGIPIIGEAGIGYSIMEGYRLPPVMFTLEEATSLVLGSKLIHQVTDPAVKRQFDSAMYKIKAVLRSSDKDYVEELDSKVAIQASPVPVDETANRFLPDLRSAIVNKNVIFLKYIPASRNEMTVREVEPIGLFYYGQTWHLIGWCRMRNDYRDFRIDRINRMEIRDEKFDDSTHLSLAEYVNELKKERELQEIMVSFDLDCARFIQSLKYFYGFVSQEEKDGRVYMKFLTGHPKQFCRWLLTFTNRVRIEYPKSLQKIVRTLLEELRVVYESPASASP